MLLRGESGTGKELFATRHPRIVARARRPVHQGQLRGAGGNACWNPNCSATRRARSPARSPRRKGRFELADGGTLFLDEIGEISPAFQAKLLRVLQEQEFERVGGNHTIKVDVRIVGATNRNLEEAVAKNEFRADLYYRINVVPMFLPPLRERPTDIPLLAGAFLEHFNKENERELAFGSASMELLKGCSFPGNVRELENCVRRTATLAPGPAIHADDFACHHDECLSSILWKSHTERVTPQRPPPEIPLRSRRSSGRPSRAASLRLDRAVGVACAVARARRPTTCRSAIG